MVERWSRRPALSADGSSNCIWVLDVTQMVPEEDALADAVFAGAKRPKKRPAVTLSPQNHGNQAFRAGLLVVTMMYGFTKLT